MVKKQDMIYTLTTVSKSVKKKEKFRQILERRSLGSESSGLNKYQQNRAQGIYN